MRADRSQLGRSQTPALHASDRPLAGGGPDRTHVGRGSDGTASASPGDDQERLQRRRGRHVGLQSSCQGRGRPGEALGHRGLAPGRTGGTDRRGTCRAEGVTHSRPLERLHPLETFAGTLALFPGASLDFSHMAAIIGRVSPAVRSQLGAFSRSSLPGLSAFPVSAAPDGAPRARDPWPMPPPRVPAPRDLRSGRSRERERVRRSALQLVQQAVVALNWLTLGMPTSAPVGARSCDPVSPAQQAMLDCLLRQASVAVRVSRRGGSDLGRALSKLCASETSLRSLGEAATALSETLVGSSLIPASLRLPDTPLADAAAWRDVSASTVSLDITASRIKWELPPTFDPRPFLPAPLQAAFDDPESLRLPREDWPPAPPPARVHAFVLR